MIPAERQRAILALLSNQEVIGIHDLTQQLQVSHMTIRRDIAKLEVDGRVMSVSGGVQLTEMIHSELSHDVKIGQNNNEKAGIGLYASNLIEPNATIYLDAGTTTLEIAHHLVHRDDLLVVTNDFAITAFLLNNSECNLYHTGGKIDRMNQSCVGEKAARLLNEINIDLAFVSTSSWSQRGISTPSEDKVLVKKAVIASSRVNYLVSDSSKYGKVATFHAVDIDSFDKIITDIHFPASCIQGLSERGIEVVTVK
ncbi:DeoR/GlpR family DNA-binding transcription regulator [Photobacterium sp.]|uniref:DeoR/GlpR family DNA-binding transcription regulator n=1 Tax=Photobacterium sp. TaxID=660 RepID=UPI00299E4778|nr:DeoR/GlpR family DNA-binding transcription regulator [Photobacterium sp.]MDX1302944.1 DeoR/GlpR family DNA-binding transcription regulator [Photobacterium sp.]